MATNYSLVCWGGKTGKAVTASNSSGLVFTSATHGLRDKTALVFSGATPPGGVTFGTTYYAKSLSADNFSIYTDANLTNRVVWSSAGSGVIAKSKTMLDYMSAYPTRWGAIGSERIYGGIESWETTRRANTTKIDEEVCELGEAFTDTTTLYGNYGNYTTDINIPAAKVTVTSLVNGVQSAAYHGGSLTAGYCLVSSYSGLGLYSLGTTLDGFRILVISLNGVYQTSSRTVLSRLIVQAAYPGSGTGIRLTSATSSVSDCVLTGLNVGLFIGNSVSDISVTGCTATKNNYGMQLDPYYESSVRGTFCNNVSLGNNTQNWSPPPNTDSYATNNAGGTAEAWKSTTGTRVEITEASPFTATFLDFTNNVFKPKDAGSQLVDTGTVFYGITAFDISGDERPNYNNGGAEAYDIGAYEFNHGYGPHPASTTVTFSGVVAGSEIRVYDAGLNELAGVESCAADHVLTWTVPSPATVGIKIINTAYKIKDFSYNSTAGNQTIPTQMELDQWFSNPA